MGRQSVFLSALGSFLALSLFAGRYQHALSFSREWITVLIYIYAGLNVLFAEPYTLSINVLVFTLLAIPLKIALYFAGYSLLLEQTAPDAGSVLKKTPQDNGRRSQASPENKTMPNRNDLPEASVAVQLSGLWGFLYLLWRYPSGRLVVFVMVGSIGSGIFVLLTNLKEVTSVLKALISK